MREDEYINRLFVLGRWNNRGVRWVNEAAKERDETVKTRVKRDVRAGVKERGWRLLGSAELRSSFWETENEFRGWHGEFRNMEISCSLNLSEAAYKNRKIVSRGPGKVTRGHQEFQERKVNQVGHREGNATTDSMEHRNRRAANDLVVQAIS